MTAIVPAVVVKSEQLRKEAAKEIEAAKKAVKEEAEAARRKLAEQQQ